MKYNIARTTKNMDGSHPRLVSIASPPLIVYDIITSKLELSNRDV